MQNNFNNRAIFNLQRFLILQSKLNPQTSDFLPDHYMFAWYAGVFPYFEEDNLHKDLEEYFSITKKQVETISEYLDSEWHKDTLYTFDELEKHFISKHESIENITRIVLLHTLRYIYLRGSFNDAFWVRLLEPEHHPTEAISITMDFYIDEINFL